MEYTIEEVRKAFGEYAKSQGRDKAKGLLQEMGYGKVTEIPPGAIRRGDDKNRRCEVMPEEHSKTFSVGVKEVDKLPCVNRNGK